MYPCHRDYYVLLKIYNIAPSQLSWQMEESCAHCFLGVEIASTCTNLHFIYSCCLYKQFQRNLMRYLWQVPQATSFHRQMKIMAKLITLSSLLLDVRLPLIISYIFSLIRVSFQTVILILPSLSPLRDFFQ